MKKRDRWVRSRRHRRSCRGTAAATLPPDREMRFLWGRCWFSARACAGLVGRLARYLFGMLLLRPALTHAMLTFPHLFGSNYSSGVLPGGHIFAPTYAPFGLSAGLLAFFCFDLPYWRAALFARSVRRPAVLFCHAACFGTFLLRPTILAFSIAYFCFDVSLWRFPCRSLSGDAPNRTGLTAYGPRARSGRERLHSACRSTRVIGIRHKRNQGKTVGEKNASSEMCRQEY